MSSRRAVLLLLLLVMACFTLVFGAALLFIHALIAGAKWDETPWLACDQTMRCRRDCAASPLTAGCCTAHLMELVRAVRRAADTMTGVQTLAIAGTLLGAMRDGGIIPWTADVDLGILRNDLPRLLEALRADPSVRVFLADKIWRVCRAAPVNQTVLDPQVKAHNRIGYIDLFDMQRVAPNLQRKTKGGVQMADLNCNPFPLSMVYPTRAQPVCLYNDTRACLDVMAQPELYLEHLYGPLWRKPPAKLSLHGKGEHKCTLRKQLVY